MSDRAALIETHISYVFLVGDRAYKLKKPIKTAFLDYSTRDARLWACEREVELNRRLSPDVYLGVSPVLDVGGSPCDSLVVMRRMASDRSLSALVRSRAELGAEVRRIARLIAAFHSRATRSPETSAAAGVDSVRANWEANFVEMRDSIGPVFQPGVAERVETLVRNYLSGRAPLFEERQKQGMGCDGHGDLKADDIFCLEDGPRILDCIEFNDHFRHGDVLADVAFLAMDLERLGASAMAHAFLRSYVEFSGETHPESLVDHYVAYRAHVRAKVASIRHQQGDKHAAAEARRLLAICHRHLELARVRLVLIGGLPASGKSTIAAKLSERLGWAVIRSDEVRKDLAAVGHGTSAAAAPGEGLYRPELVESTYTEMLRRARVALERGVSVILDATWREERTREAARRLADATFSDLTEIRCAAPLELLRRRLARRKPGGAMSSDATVDVLDRMEFEPWRATDIDTSVTVSKSLAAAMALTAPTTSGRPALRTPWRHAQAGR